MVKIKARLEGRVHLSAHNALQSTLFEEFNFGSSGYNIETNLYYKFQMSLQRAAS
jgi:hypothetical protein